MEKRQIWLFILALALTTVFAGAPVCAQTPAEKEKKSAANVAADFPAAWNGVWKGLTVNVAADGKREEIPMELHVLPLSQGRAHSWKILYGKDAAQTTRPYEIMPVDGDPNRFVVDEKNGLLIDNQLVGSVLYSQFMVTTNLVTTRFELKGDEMRVELLMFDLRAPRQSKLNGGNIEVASYRFRSAQSGVLKKSSP